jgi:hypothetical protein
MIEYPPINWMLCAKVLGVILLAPFIIIEILAICLWKMGLNHNPPLPSTFDDDINQRLQDAEKIAKHVEDILVMFENLLHYGLVPYTIIALWPEQCPKPPSRYPGLHICLKFRRLLPEL